MAVGAGWARVAGYVRTLKGVRQLAARRGARGSGRLPRASKAAGPGQAHRARSGRHAPVSLLLILPGDPLAVSPLIREEFPQTARACEVPGRRRT